MIKYEKEFDDYECEGIDGNKIGVISIFKKELNTAIRSLLLRQQEVDNKRFMEMMGEDETARNFEEAIYIAGGRNRLRQELRDKLTKIDKEE